MARNDSSIDVVPSQAPGTAQPTLPDREFLPSLALIRGAAALMVVYDHLVGVWPSSNGVSWRPALAADKWVFEPLHLMMHGGGMAVAMFFLVSGFVIFFVAHRETCRQFVVRRALRIFPPLWASIALLIVAYALYMAFYGNATDGQTPLHELLRRPHPWVDLAAAMSLTNYLVGTPALNGVAWTLVIEVLFYAAVALLLPLLRTRPRLAMIVAFTCLLGLQVFARAHWALFLLAVNGVYVTFLFLGSLIYLRWSARIGNVFFATSTVVLWALFLHGVDNFVLQPPYRLSDYGVSYAMAWLAFVGLLLLDDRLRLGRVSLFFSRISYSLYLNHGDLGYLALSVLVPVLGYTSSLAIALVLVIAISAASWRWIEAPSQRLARKWTSAPRPTALSAPVQQPSPAGGA